jgi:signal transduction histidine kinase
MKRMIASFRAMWQTVTSDLCRLWSDPPLSPEARGLVASQAVRWVMLPSMIAVAASGLMVIASVGLSEPTRFIPLVVFVAPCFVVLQLQREERWLAAAAVFCTAATLAVMTGVVFNGLRAPIYDLSVLVLLLVATLFGLRWATLTAFGLAAAGAIRLVLEAYDLTFQLPPPSSALTFGLRVCVIGLSLALVGGPQLLLSNALRDANHERLRADHARAVGTASEHAFHAVFHQASVALALLTSKGRIAQLNARAQIFLDRREASIVGCLFASSERWSDAQRELLQRAVEQAALGHASRHEVTMMQQPGQPPAVYQIVLSPFLAAGCVEHVLAEIVDVTDLVETRGMLAQARRLEALGKLSGGVAHDLNNMFAAILGGCELVRIARGDARKIEEHVKLIQASVQRGATLTKQLLAFGRQDRWNSEQLDVNTVMNDVARLLERTLHKNIDLLLSPSDQPAYVRADAAAMEHALLNLALNAQDAMREGGTLTLTCRPGVVDAAASARLRNEVAPGPCVFVSVDDTGTGMSNEVQERMFEPFFTTKALGEGTGLGLAAVHGTMRAHHGAIVVNSQPGIGTRIELILPATDPIAVHSEIDDIEVPIPTRLDARVLLADDEALARSAISSMLLSVGCEVHAVADGAALIDALAEGVMPDIIVTDLAMPGVGGINLVQTLEALQPHTPLLLITGYTGDDVASVSPPRRGRRLLRKPFLRGELLGTMAELLAHSRHPHTARFGTGRMQRV